MSALLSLLLLGQIGTAVVPEPIAVLPFKKQQSSDLPRLQAAIAETLATDIHNSGFVTVPWSTVRSFVDWKYYVRKQPEIPLQQALQWGKQMQAGSVILGHYVRTGGEVVFRASLLSIASGKELRRTEVKELGLNIFHAQDDVARQLLGKKYRAPPRNSKLNQKSSDELRDHRERTLRAYRLYALSLSREDKTSRNLLVHALDKDPLFPYALSKWEEIQKQAKTKASIVRGPQRQLDLELRQLLNQPKLRDSKRMRALEDYIAIFELTGHIREIEKIGQRIYGQQWPNDPKQMLRAKGLFLVFESQVQRKQHQAALKTGGKFLREFPDNNRYGTMRLNIERLEKKQKERSKKQQALAEALTKLELRKMGHHFSICNTIFNHHQYLRAIEVCTRFAESNNPSHEEIRNKELQARWLIARAHYELGRFKKARKLAQELIERDPDYAYTAGIESIVAIWPTF